MLNPIIFLLFFVMLITILFYAFITDIYKIYFYEEYILVKTVGITHRKIYFKDIVAVRTSKEPTLEIERSAIDLERDYFGYKLVIVAKNKGFFSKYFKYRIFYLHSENVEKLKSKLLIMSSSLQSQPLWISV